MSSADRLPPAPPLEGWSFSGGGRRSVDSSGPPPLPARPQVVQVGLCTTSFEDVAHLWKLPGRAWRQSNMLRVASPYHLSGFEADHTAHLSTHEPASSPLLVRSTTPSDGGGSLSLSQIEPGLDADNTNISPASPKRPSSSRSHEGLASIEKQVSLSAPPAAKDISKLLTAVLPSAEDGKLHSLISQLRAALSEQVAATKHMQSQVCENACLCL